MFTASFVWVKLRDRQARTYVPAVYHNGSAARRVHGLDPTDEKEEGRGVGGDTKVRPSREMELGHNALLAATTLQGQEEGTDHEDWENGEKDAEEHM